MGYFLAWWAFFYAIYLLLAGKVVLDEVAAGFFISLGSAAIYCLIVRMARDQFAWRPAMLLRIPAAIPAAFMDCFIVLAAALAKDPPAGAIKRKHFEPIPGEEEDRLRRAIEIQSLTIAPNTIVVDLTEKSIVLHRLVER